MERLFLGKWLARIGKASVLYTFFVVTIGWVFFKTEHIRQGFGFIGRMFSSPIHHFTDWEPDKSYVTILTIAVLFSFFTISKWGRNIQQKVFYKEHSTRMHVLMTAISLILFILSAARITQASFNPFIYFRF